MGGLHGPDPFSLKYDYTAPVMTLTAWSLRIQARHVIVGLLDPLDPQVCMNGVYLPIS